MIKTAIKSTDINKTKQVNEMFSKIARKYDLLNNLMTFGMHNKWKEETIKLALKANDNPLQALDLCSGTGDLAIILKKYCPNTKVICIDNCTEMLDITKSKIERLKLKDISLLLTNSEELLFSEASFDLVTIGFGLRNLFQKEKCIENVYKLLKDNGTFACIDLGHPKNNFWKKIFFYYFYRIVPELGQIFAKDKDAYTYLPTSLKSWYKQEDLKELILNKGFKNCYLKNVFGGVVAIHIAIK